MKDLLAFLRSWYFVIVDAPPLLPVTDGALLAKNADGALVVAAARKTGTESLHRAVGNVERVQARTLGLVLNGVSGGRLSRLRYGDPEYGYGAGYGYDSAYGQREKDQSAETPGPQPERPDRNIGVEEPGERTGVTPVAIRRSRQRAVAPVADDHVAYGG